MYIGRKVDDMIRLIDAQIFNDKKGGMCPANWEKENV
jgi:alkyl hydroperoxide reductase subunit AhpC